MSPATVTLPSVPTQLYVDGAWRDPVDGATFEVIAPATEERLTTLAAATGADVELAVKAARREIDGGAWSRLPASERGVLLARLADLVERDVETLARLEAFDIGRPIGEPLQGDIPATAQVFRHFAGWADKIDGRAVPLAPSGERDRFAYTRLEPVGVVGAITAWNAPTMIAAWKLAPALAAGNAVVLKPAEDASLSTMHLAKLIEEAGFPPGVVSVLPGLGEVAGAALVAHPGVDKLSFTGSPEVGRQIAVHAAQTFKRVTLELGGKSPSIVLGDADVEELAPWLAFGFCVNQGEICAAGTRILVAEPLYDRVVAGVAEAVGKVRMGEPFEPDVTMGALINASQRDRVLGYIEKGKDEGVELVAGGSRPERPGYFVEPTVFAGTDNRSTIAQEEIFGPVGVIVPFRDEAEAIAIANDTKYGLAAYVWTNDLAKAHRFAAEVRAGNVWINGAGAPDPRLPWGGMKTSGVGRELGWAGILANCEEKTVTVTL